MFLLRTPEHPYTDPWLQPLDERLRMLAAGQRRVAYYYESANNSTFRYRAYNMAQVLNARLPGHGGNETSAGYFFRNDLHCVDDIAALADVLVICRSGYEHHVAQLIARFRALGKKVLFDIDDFVFDTDYTHLIIDTLALDKNDPRVWDDWFGMIARMGQTLRRCDGAITTNAFLAQRIHDFAGVSVAVVPNFMNREQLSMSEAIFAEKQAGGFTRDGTLTLGYFSGSPSHRLDYAIVEPALEGLLRDRPDVRVMTVGYIEPGPRLAPYADRILRQPFHDYVNLQRLVGSVEINLMPLQSNVFTDCKSELKYFEAAASGTLSVASPSHNYAACIQHGRNGFLAQAHAWRRQLDEALALMDSYAPMATAARDDALARYGWQSQRPCILTALGWADPVAAAAA
ncbi:MAG TPA: glycosyltransferase [Ramlibacter sp.]|nr:glycosyltransferase [Ramlibacter sp.]